MPKLQGLSRLLAESSHCVFLTGAGISTESGIPDFRGPKGIWKTAQPIMYQDFVASEEARLRSWANHRKARGVMLGAEPNAAHRAVADWLLHQRRASVITQNVDGLHQQGGAPQERVVEVHGNATFARCLSCARRYELDEVDAKLDAHPGQSPMCDGCGGLLKSATISFGQPMPESEMRRAQAEVVNCDLLVVAGSSLVVEPVASLPVLAYDTGAKLAICNAEPTPLDGIAALCLRGQLGTVLPQAVLEALSQAV